MKQLLVEFAKFIYRLFALTGAILGVYAIYKMNSIDPGWLLRVFQ